VSFFISPKKAFFFEVKTIIAVMQALIQAVHIFIV
jgi:hypothetical protein